METASRRTAAAIVALIGLSGAWLMAASCVHPGPRVQDPAGGSQTTPGARTLDGEFERTVGIRDTLVLDVRTPSGRIDVTAGNSGQVRIRGRIRGYAGRWTPDGTATVERRVRDMESAPPAEVAGHHLRVGHLASSRHRQVGISYSVEVSPNTRVRAETGAGMLLVSGVTGGVEARTGSGNTRVSDVAGDVAVEADSGDIELTAVGGDMDLRTGSGSIRIEGVGAGLRARKGSGRVRVVAPARAWNLRAESGDIRIDLPDDAAFEVDAQTAAGGVCTNHPCAARRGPDGSAAPSRVRPRVTRYTGSGGINDRLTPARERAVLLAGRSVTRIGWGIPVGGLATRGLNRTWHALCPLRGPKQWATDYIDKEVMRCASELEP